MGAGGSPQPQSPPLDMIEHTYYIVSKAPTSYVGPIQEKWNIRPPGGTKESHESHGPHFGPSQPSGMGPPGPRHAPPPTPIFQTRVPWPPHRPTEDLPNSQRSLSAHLPTAPSRRGCPRSLAADGYPRLTPPASLPHDRGCLRHCAADDLPLRLPWRRSGCLRHCAADEFPLRPLRRRSGCLRHCAADDLPRPDSSRSGPGRRGSAGNPHPLPLTFLAFPRRSGTTGWSLFEGATPD